MKKEHQNWGGVRAGAGRKKTTKYRTVVMKVPVHITDIIGKYAKEHKITKVAALTEIWEKDYAPKEKELITPIELASLEGKLKRIQIVLAEWEKKIEAGKEPCWNHVKKMWEELNKA